ncbi:MAG: protein TolQ [Betaproteobacteria bacterium]|nr:protein TolQ [Betaproteobacteria bacterium]NBT74660.1 protein TolQ [Betaproteobacteria bacterium]NBY14055.1 protein TolQ [Betaproteobacteria bacterium]NCA15980.1 protein TolQ [Betaproteobacteria bacterium]NDF04451.1 protein TolQ [Betaproteobacteria bacterium]
MNAPADLSVLALVLQASLPVQLVILTLVAISIYSWTVIFKKYQVIKRVSGQSEAFEKEFWSGGDLMVLYDEATRGRHGDGLARVFEAGMREYLKLRKQPGAQSANHLEGARRAMRAASQREFDGLERGLPFLATAGSVSPYVGLFGTVWGIMHAFTGLANIQQATLASVAPGIAEALVATAIGLFAAIPAVVAYNRFTTDVDRLSIRFETFMEEFSNILQRQA